VCTGNVCRSPLAERLLDQELARRGVPADVSSAGLVGDGMPASPEIVELLAAGGIDGSGHRSRLLRADVLAGADLVLGMAREHVREAVLLDPAAFRRTFTLKELVRRARATGPRRTDEVLGDWLDRVGTDRRPAAALGASSEDDIVDPIGRSMAVYQEVADEIGSATRALADLAWGAPVPGSRRD
jgi:protein-tyrosine phosphatase